MGYNTSSNDVDTIRKCSKEEIQKEEEKSWPQVFAILVASLAGFVCGTLFVWPSPSMLKIVNDKENYDISEDEASYFATIPSIFMLLTSVLFLKLNDIIGRKYTILLIAIPHIIAWTLIAFAKSVYVFYFSRCLAGLADAALFASIPIYVGEVATPKVRGSWGNAFGTFIYSGELAINAVGSYFSIQTTAFIFIIFPIIFAIAMPFMPETPYYYLIKGKEEEAKKSLRYLRQKENVEDELESIKAAVQRQLSEPNTWADLFKIDSNRKAIFCGLFLRFAQQLAGTSAFVVYNQLFFSKAGGNFAPEVSSIIFFSLIVCLNICAGSILDRLGRKKPFLYSLALCALSLYLESTYLYIDELTDIDVTYLNWIPLTGLVTYCFVYSFGVGIVPTLMLSELFSASIKGKALCIMNIGFGLAIMITTQVFHLLLSHVGVYCPFLFFAVCSTISAILTLFFVPETKGKTLEEIQQILKGNKSVQ